MTEINQHAEEVEKGERFQFGKNWSSFLKTLSDKRIQEAENSLKNYLGLATLVDKNFLDIGSGSGLFSLAARNLGAKVRSFDYDPESEACTRELKSRYYPNNEDWEISSGSVLDREFLFTLGTFDIVYSWGVLHHTGRMWEAINNSTTLVKPDGLLYIAIYNHQNYWSAFYTQLKKIYNKAPKSGKVLLAGFYILSQMVTAFLRDVLFFTNPRKRYRDKIRERGMSKFHDWMDWIGGYPFEVSKPEEVFDYLRTRGFTLVKLKTMGGGLGCNEFLFRKKSTTSSE